MPLVHFSLLQVSLTLEEKQRLAKEQEQQRFLKVNKPLEAKGSTGGAASRQTNSNKPKDLTSSLMQSNVMNLASSGSKPAANYSSLNSGTSFSPLSQTHVSSMSSGSTVNTSGFNTGFSQNGKAQKSKPVDLSSFDNLLSTSSNTPKMSMSQMSQSRMGPQGMMGNQSMMGNVQGGMMGAQGGMMGNQGGMMGNLGGMMGSQGGMMGSQGGMMSHQGGMMGNTGMRPQQGMLGGGAVMNSGFGGTQLGSFGLGGGSNQGPGFPANQGMLQPQPIANQNFNSQGSAKNDFDDLFG